MIVVPNISFGFLVRSSASSLPALSVKMSFGYSAGDFLAILQLANELRSRFAQAPRQYKAITDEYDDSRLSRVGAQD